MEEVEAAVGEREVNGRGRAWRRVADGYFAVGWVGGCGNPPLVVRGVEERHMAECDQTEKSVRKKLT